jgi:hypothetical protein
MNNLEMKTNFNEINFKGYNCILLTNSKLRKALNYYSFYAFKKYERMLILVLRFSYYFPVVARL